MDNVNYLQIVRLSWDERFKMYMKRPKKELASMLAERDKYSFPQGCKEFEKDDEVNATVTSSSTYTYSSKTEEP